MEFIVFLLGRILKKYLILLIIILIIGQVKKMFKKKISVFLIFLCFVSSFFVAQENKNFTNIQHFESKVFIISNKNENDLTYFVNDKTIIFDNKWNVVNSLKENNKISGCSMVETNEHFMLVGKDNYWINADDLYVYDSTTLPEEIVYNQIEKTSEWVPVWYKDVINCNDNEFKEVVYNNAPYLKNKWIDDAECWWYEDSLFSYPCVMRFTNTYFSMTVDGWGVHNFIVEKIAKKDDKYYITCSSQGFFYNDYIGNISYLENFPQLNNEGDFTLRLELNKNNLFLFNDKTDKIITELMLVSSEWIQKLQSYFNTGINPFKVDDNYSYVTNVAQNKKMKFIDLKQ